MIYSWLNRLLRYRAWRCLWRHRWEGPNYEKTCKNCGRVRQWIWE